VAGPEPCGSWLADDEAVSLDIDLLVCVVLSGLIAGKASSHRDRVEHRYCGWPRTLWESALPTMRPSASTSILLVCVVLAGFIAGKAPQAYLPASGAG